MRVTPYLHERRVYIRQREPNKRYFLTSMDVRRTDREAYNAHLYEHIVQDGRGLNDTQVVPAIREDGVVLQPAKRARRKQVDSFQVIMRMNITDSQYHVYAQNGMLLKRINFYDIKRVHGDPICCSNNGRVLVFRVRGNHLQYMHRESIKKVFEQRSVCIN